MATKNDTVAAKQRRQKFILAGIGVVLAAVLAFQGPKLLHHGSSSPSSSAESASGSTDSTTSTTTTGTTTTGTGATTGSAPTPAPARTGPTATLAGIRIASSARPVPAQGQLWSFNRFKAKDPFLPQVVEPSATSSGVAAPGGTAGAGNAATPQAAGTAVGTGPSVGSGGLVVPTQPGAVAALAYATILVNGKPQQLQLKQIFPKSQPTFVLRRVGKRFVTIGVAGGRFTDGSAVKLVLGEQVTLLNTATGQRFVIKLVYVGAQPEAIASFRAAPGRTTASTGK
jgi:hypothetical protein